jgi:hypothetical protein
MLHNVFHFVLVNGVRVASAILPAAPLLGQKLTPALVARSAHPKKDALTR